MSVGPTPHVISSLAELANVVDEIRNVGMFAFDVETRGVLERHPDVEEVMIQDWKMIPSIQDRQ